MPSEPKSQESPIPFQVGCSPICDVVRKPKRRKRKSRPWHRWLGLITALPLIWVLATGVVLNHAEDWGLHEKMTTNPTVLSWYGMTPKSEPQSIELNGLKITHWDGLTFLQEEPLKLNGSFVAAIPFQQGCMVASTEEVLLFDAEGGLIETLDELSLPELPLIAVGENKQLPALKNATGWHQPDEDWIEFTEIEGVERTAA